MALLLVPGLAVAGPVLSGIYRADAYGTLELKTEGGHVSGVVVEGGACRFPPQKEVLVGDFEGSVLVARLTVCQTGETCAPVQTYTVLGFYSEEENSVVAFVRLPVECHSPGLPKTGRFALEPVPKDIPEDPSASGTGGAPEPTGKKGSRNVDAAKQSSQRGDQLYKANKFNDAAKQFKQSIEYDSGETNWPAYLGRGSSLLKMGKVKEAIKDLEKSHSFNPNDPSILYMLGCAYGQKGDKPKAMKYLTLAVNAGYQLHSAIDHDADLTNALGNEPEFKELVKSSREKNARGTAGSGTPP